MKRLRNLLLEILSMLILALVSLNTSAQENTFKKERRIYLWDVTISMVGATSSEVKDGRALEVARPGHNPDNPHFTYDTYVTDPTTGMPRPVKYYNEVADIFVPTREALIDDIRALDEACEVVVIPYTTDFGSIMSIDSATEVNKDYLISQVMAWSDLKAGGTYTGRCLQKVIDKWFNKDDGRYNRVILLTDGCPSEYSDERTLLEIVGKWKDTNADPRFKDNRMVYVILTDEAKRTGGEIDKVSGDDDKVAVVPSLDDLQKDLRFSLSGLTQEHVIAEDEITYGFSIEVECNIIMAGKKSGPAKCLFATDDDYVSIRPESIEPKGGKFIIPINYNLNSRVDYMEAFGGEQGHVATIICHVDPACENVTLEGNNKISLKLGLIPQPKATISLSIK